MNWNEIRSRATTFAYEWKQSGYEKGDSQTFITEFFDVFGVSRKRVASFEQKVKKIDGNHGFIDMLWKSVLLIEQKSLGKDLTRAFKQATDYFYGLADYELPRYILVSDFARFRLYDLIENAETEFTLTELPNRIELFGFMIGMASKKDEEDKHVSITAAEKMGLLHDRLKKIGYEGHALEQYLVRLLFCMFADDTSIFEKNIFREYIANTKEDGSDLASALDILFYILNTEKRLNNLDDRLKVFPYVNGGLFADRLPPASFDGDMRKTLLECCSFDWGFISPSIFGSMFQAAMSSDKRRELGAHYTEESNILKVIHPLFLDELREELESIKTNRKKLEQFHDKLANLRFLDPACGTGNFLIIAYREIRKLEKDVLLAMYTVQSNTGSQMTIQMAASIELLAKVNVDQFYGIEIDEFACEIARVGMWLMDHQCNMELSLALGQYYRRLPLVKSATIVHGNALQLSWQGVVPNNKLSYILGNPPFVGYSNQTETQKSDMLSVFKGMKTAGKIDYVAAWYKVATEYIRGTRIHAAFVSTNSITQGEQVAPLWSLLLKSVQIYFAYRTFFWSSAARGKAAVHCVIIGFGYEKISRPKLIFETDSKAIEAANINGYLLNAPNIFVESRSKPLCNVPEMVYGNKPTDGGHLFIEADEYEEFLQKEPNAAKYIRRIYGATEYINNEKRYCLWLVGANPGELKKMPHVMERIELVRKMRLDSDKQATRECAQTPTLFMEIRQPSTPYIIVPCHSSERRAYIPFGFLGADIIVNNAVQIIPNATLYHFGVLTCNIHMAWVRAVCGRIKSDYRYSKDIVYNNFPWPDPTDRQREAVEQAAQGVLDARNLFPNDSLATLYDPLLMPAELVKAHNALDSAVKKAYGGKGFKTEAERVADLMERYARLIAK